MGSKPRGDKPPIKRAPNTSLAEWIVASVSAILVAGVVGFLIYDGTRSPKIPPEITVEVDSIQAAGPGYLVLFRAINAGSATAAEVVVEGELEGDGRRVEASETTLDYVPPNALVRGGLYFAHDPRRSRLKLRAHGYRDP
jgi:uncharacterized protein (TIGR02588 family)